MHKKFQETFRALHTGQHFFLVTSIYSASLLSISALEIAINKAF